MGIPRVPQLNLSKWLKSILRPRYEVLCHSDTPQGLSHRYRDYSPPDVNPLVQTYHAILIGTDLMQ